MATEDESTFTVEDGTLDPSTRHMVAAATGGGTGVVEVPVCLEKEPAPVDHEALVTHVRDELVNLWADLEDAVRMAANGSWSGGCERLMERIKALSDLVGPASWQDISIPFLLSETYRQVCEDIGHPCAATVAELAKVRDAWTAQVAQWAR
jgi:hypothetical protein